LAEWPRTHFLVGDIDPMLDDTLYFASKLKKVRAALVSFVSNAL
jgi:hypothetical protein